MHSEQEAVRRTTLTTAMHPNPSPTMRISIRPVLLALFVLALAACVGTGKNSPQPQAQSSVRIQNQAWVDLNIFAVEGGGSDGSRRRLGTINGNSTAVFRLPDSLVGTGRDVRFIADPVGSAQTANSYSIYVRPGDQVTLTIPSTFGR